MKNYAITLLTLATAFLAVSCQKENVPVEKSEYSPAAIKAEINAINTSSADDKYEVLWQENAKIYLTDGTNSGTYTLSAGKGSVSGTFSRDAEVKYNGSVKAYYPETLVGDGPLIWPSVQTVGQAVPLYGNVNLTGTEPENMKLTSMGAVLQILYVSNKENIVLNSIRIQDAEKTLSGTFEVDGNGQAVITSTDGSGITLYLGQDGVTVGKEVQKFYVAVPAGEYNNLSVIFSTPDGEQVLRNRKLNASSNTVCSLSLNSSLSAAKESVQLWAGGPYWATTNVGTTAPEGIGLFYAWGFYQKGKGSDYSWTAHVWGGDDNGLPCLITFSPYSMLAFSQWFWDYNIHEYEDIAQFEWGEKWRLPTKEEFQGLLDNCTLESTTIGGVNGWKFTGKGEYSGNSIFLPATGLGYERDWLHLEDSGYYWSSTAMFDENAYVFQWYDNGQPAMNFITKYHGCVVRPVTDDPSKPVLPENLLPGNFSTASGHSVYFTKGNLYYNYNDEAFHFEENQYDYPAEWDIYHVGHFFWSDNESVAYAKIYDGQGAAQNQVFFTNSKSDPSKPRDNFAVDGIAGKYCILREPDWNYILNDRPNASSLKKTGVTVCDKKNCLILAPDNYKGTIQLSYDAESWLKAESEGLVCLPAGGHRIGVNTMLGGIGGYYPTFNPPPFIGSRSLHFRSNYVYAIDGVRSFGYSVRLVYVD